MLDAAEYLELWNDQFAPIVPAGTIMPPYIEYAIRERMFQDYLDIFRGRNTRVEGYGMPYPHPFFNADGTPLLVNKPCIKYILIGEACPEFGANYFYDILAINGQGYLNAAYNATYNGIGPAIPWAALHIPLDKINKLLDLASRGVLLIDLFPFALNYTTTIREQLNDADITTSFFNNIHNLYSVTNRINGFVNEGLICEDFNNHTNSVFIAPKTISYHLATIVNAIVPIVTFSLIFTIGENSLRLMPPHFILNAPHNDFYILIPAGTTLGGFPLPLNGGGIYTIMVPRYICCAYQGAGFLPHALFITNALL